MKLIVTILEKTPAAALDAIRAVDGDHDGIELRVDAIESRPFDLRPFRDATGRMLIVTDRTDGTRRQYIDIAAAVDAGVDFVDVEYGGDLDRETVARFADRIVLSHHDYEAVPELEPLVGAMKALGCAHTKIAATPRTFRENRALLEAIGPGVTVIGMGERGLYARILAPFFGSELAFVSAGEPEAAPGQFSLARALAIYGDRNLPPNPRIFAVAGNPAGKSLSPSLHNPMFRERGVAAAYTIASVHDFSEVALPFAAAEPFAPTGLSVTTPFKEEALVFARASGADIRPNAIEAKAVNTLVRHGGTIVADNTDVDGFETLLREVCGRDRKTVALIGAGATARAALVALSRLGMPVMIYNRTLSRAEALARSAGAQAHPLAEVSRFDGELVIDATTANIDVPLRAGMTYLRASYGTASRMLDKARAAGAHVIDGLELLRAQAVRQNEMFVESEIRNQKSEE